MPEHLSEETKQGVIFGEGQDPEEKYEGKGLTHREEERPEIVVGGRSQDFAVYQCHNTQIGELTLNLLRGSATDFCMDVLHSEEAHEED